MATLILAFILQPPEQRWTPFAPEDAIYGGLFCLAVSLVWFGISWATLPRGRPLKISDGFWLVFAAGFGLLALAVVLEYLGSRFHYGPGPAIG